MALYRVKQFIWAITSKFKPIDEGILNSYLNKKEKMLFKSLSVSQQHHSIRVCKEALDKYSDKSSIDKTKLAKIALLHDIGKIDNNINIIDNSIIVILDKLTKGNLKKLDKNNKINTYYNHPRKAVKLLKDVDRYDKEFIEAIEKHHYKNVGNNLYLKIIKECDDNN